LENEKAEKNQLLAQCKVLKERIKDLESISMDRTAEADSIVM
jgi:hypothetical protein